TQRHQGQKTGALSLSSFLNSRLCASVLDSSSASLFPALDIFDERDERGLMKGKVGFIPGAHKIEFREYDVPEPPAGGLIAEVTQTNVCGSEVHMWKGEFGGKRGIMPGHEMAGRIQALGEGVKTARAGGPVRA